jgi:heparin lyase
VSPKIVDGKWVAVSSGTYGSIHAGAVDPGDPTMTCDKFTMDRAAAGFKKDRNELCRVFTRLGDYQRLSTSISDISDLTACRYIYSLSPAPETRCNQGSHMEYSFKIRVGSWSGTRANVNVIFAQWHGMPNSLFFKVPNPASTPPYILDGPKTPAAAFTMWNTYQFKGGYSRAGHPPGSQYRYVEQGGRPPLAIKFKNDKVQVVTNGDARYFSDKYIPGTTTKFRPGPTDPNVKEGSYDVINLADFPLNKWVTVSVNVQWAVFASATDGVTTRGTLNVDLSVPPPATLTRYTPVRATNLIIGRNDQLGYYFKYGCYRHSVEPVEFYLKDYTERVLP